MQEVKPTPGECRFTRAGGETNSGGVQTHPCRRCNQLRGSADSPRGSPDSPLQAVKLTLQEPRLTLQEPRLALQELRLALQEGKINLQELRLALQEGKINLQEGKINLQEAKPAPNQAKSAPKQAKTTLSALNLPSRTSHAVRRRRDSRSDPQPQREGDEGKQIVEVVVDDRAHDGEVQFLVAVDRDVAKAHHALEAFGELVVESAGALEE